MNTRLNLIIAVTSIGFIAIACDSLFPDGPDPQTVLAEPIQDLTAQQLQLHAAGDADFAQVFGVEEGLGPIFVNTSCEGCHVGDGKGHPFSTLTRFGRYDGVNWDPMVEFGGPQLQNRAIPDFIAEQIPVTATGITKITPPAVTGLGFVEALDDATLLALQDPVDLDGDGISGRVNYVIPPDFFEPKPHHVPDEQGRYIGRFGKKASAIDLFQQSVQAYREDMGITSDFLPQDLTNIQVTNSASDGVPEPEVGSSTVFNVVFYLRTLKAPPRRNSTTPNVLAGETLFAQVGCGKCHLPELRSGITDVQALSQKTFYPYSDFLLHDMGPSLDDGYMEGSSSSAEWRTPPLWGIGLSSDSQGGQLFLLHDGRATTLEEAVLLHGGEAQVSRESYESLSTQERDQLLEFLESL